jgi:hypothetical protein
MMGEYQRWKITWTEKEKRKISPIDLSQSPEKIPSMKQL